MTLFRRTARVEITTSENEVLTFRNLRFVFTVEKTEKAEPNNLDLEIFNLSANTRNKLRDSTIGKNVTVYAGYEEQDGEQLLFTGDVTSVSSMVLRPDTITKIMALDGKVSVDKAKVTIAQSEKASGRAVLERILGTFDIGNNLSRITFTNKIYENGFSYAGPSKKALDKVTKYLGLDWSIQNNEIILVPFDGNDNTGSLLLSPTTGLIGSPERISGETRKAKDTSKKVTPGWRVRSLLLPSITPRGRIILQSAEIEKQTPYTVTFVSHVGDTFGPNWESTIEVKE